MQNHMSLRVGDPNLDDLRPHHPVTDFVRAVLHIIVGAVAGACLGLLLPVGCAILMTWQDPVGMKQGGGTPFAIMLIATVPLGAIFGAVWGYTRLHPGGMIAKKGPAATISQFMQQISHHSIEDQYSELRHAVPLWIREFRQTTINLAVIIVVLLLLSPGLLFLLIFLVVYVWRLVRYIQEMRSELTNLKSVWGDTIFDQCGPLPFLLRSVITSHNGMT